MPSIKQKEKRTSDDGDKHHIPSVGDSEQSEFLERQLLARENRRRVEGVEPPRARAVSEEHGQSRKAQHDLRKALDAQVEHNQARAQALKQFERQLDVNLLQAESREAAARRESEQAIRARQRELLRSAWQDENRIKDIRQAIEAIETGKNKPPSTVSRARVPPMPKSARQSTSTGSAITRGTTSCTIATARSTSTPRMNSTELGTQDLQGMHLGTCRDVGQPVGATPLSARGNSLGAAASLALQIRPAEVA